MSAQRRRAGSASGFIGWIWSGAKSDGTQTRSHTEKTNKRDKLPHPRRLHRGQPNTLALPPAHSLTARRRTCRKSRPEPVTQVHLIRAGVNYPCTQPRANLPKPHRDIPYSAVGRAMPVPSRADWSPRCCCQFIPLHSTLASTCQAWEKDALADRMASDNRHRDFRCLTYISRWLGVPASTSVAFGGVEPRCFSDDAIWPMTCY